MGNSKLLIIAISVLSAMALICVSAFAEDITPDFNFPLFEVGDRVDSEELVRDVGTGSDTAVPYNILEQSYYIYHQIKLWEMPYSAANAWSVYYMAVYLNGSYVFGYSGSLFSVRFGGSGTSASDPYFFNIDGNVYYLNGVTSSNVSSVDVTIYAPSSSLALRDSSTMFGDLVEEEPVNDFWDTIRGVGNSIITFVMSSWVVLVPVVAFVLILHSLNAE